MIWSTLQQVFDLNNRLLELLVGNQFLNFRKIDLFLVLLLLFFNKNSLKDFVSSRLYASFIAQLTLMLAQLLFDENEKRPKKGAPDAIHDQVLETI